MPDTIASGALPLAVLVAALAGLVSFASPCVLPLVPGFLGYVTGLSDTALEQRSHGHARSAYALGVGLPFILAATGIKRFGRVSGWVRDRHRLIQVLGGMMLVVVGLLLLTGVWEDLTRWLQAELVSGFTTPICGPLDPTEAAG